MNIKGNVETELSLSVNALKNDFEGVYIDAVCQCGGNRGSAYKQNVWF